MSENNKQPSGIKSFVRRTGRMTSGQKQAMSELQSKYCIPVDLSKLIPLDEIFSNQAEVVLDIGFGNGVSLIEQAKQNTNLNYLGIEVHTPGVAQVLQAIHQQDINNIRLIEFDAVEVLRHCFSDNNFKTIQVFFPDPWPKKKHHKRRLIQQSFVDLVIKKLKPNGIFHFATDWQPYAKVVLDLMNQQTNLKNLDQNQKYIKRPESRPLTKFEQRGLKLGHNVFDLMFEKID